MQPALVWYLAQEIASPAAMDLAGLAGLLLEALPSPVAEIAAERHNRKPGSASASRQTLRRVLLASQIVPMLDAHGARTRPRGGCILPARRRGVGRLKGGRGPYSQRDIWQVK